MSENNDAQNSDDVDDQVDQVDDQPNDGNATVDSINYHDDEVCPR